MIKTKMPEIERLEKMDKGELVIEVLKLRYQVAELQTDNQMFALQKSNETEKAVLNPEMEKRDGNAH